MIALADNGVIVGSPDVSGAAGQSSFDLTLSDQAWLMSGAIKGDASRPYAEILSGAEHAQREMSIAQRTRLHPGETYVVRLNERLNLNDTPSLYGAASGKSSIGRLDILVRLIADYSPAYDQIPAAEDSGNANVTLYAEITPISFPVIVAAGISLNQVRFIQGNPAISELSDDALRFYPGLLLDTAGEECDSVDYLTVDLRPVNGGLVGYMARRTVPAPVDIAPGTGRIDPTLYWRTVTKADENATTIKVIPERFYLMRSRERFRLPADVAVYLEAITEAMGELRVHYAGFIHPGFGYGRPGGTPLIFEIRGHNVTTFLRNGEPIGKLRYFRMSEPADLLVTTGRYLHQELTLSRYFAEWK